VSGRGWGGDAPFGFSFKAMVMPSRRSNVSFVLEKRRGDSTDWDNEGSFHARRKAKRAARHLARRYPTAELRIRALRRPPADWD
jgi:hypothetical protein